MSGFVLLSIYTVYCKNHVIQSSWNMLNTSTEQFTKDFEAYSDVVYRLCVYKTGSSEVAEDLVQDIFTKYYEYLTDHDPPENTKAFLFQSARNRIIDHYRKHTTDSLDDLSDQGLQFAERNGEPTIAEVNAEYALVLETLEQLDESYREVLYLRLVEDFSPREIAQTLGISTSNVSVRINRGKKQLVQLLQ